MTGTDRRLIFTAAPGMLFCSEQAIHGSVEAFGEVFGQTLKLDSFEKVSPRLADRAETFVQNREAPPPAEVGELLVMTAVASVRRDAATTSESADGDSRGDVFRGSVGENTSRYRGRIVPS